MGRIINLTPHDIHVVRGNEIVATFPRSGEVARAASSSIKIGELDGINIVKMQFGAPVDLPEFQKGTFYIVSMATANAAMEHGRSTSDLLLTANPVRDEVGRIIGCECFSQL